ncbi:hypothetical protein COB21_02025 [Candidatus Aerophobetes bacterium]|uniref:Uncharacterized protein n=1 Tax=Aerophobetes bacterium TaxID=2030807 RepID=A0A2A4X5W6_UNCAE|nr:MAG: hypothetical protein COB21_02025 [Candidatus Aerophobetes bacterium]
MSVQPGGASLNSQVAPLLAFLNAGDHENALQWCYEVSLRVEISALSSFPIADEVHDTRNLMAGCIHEIVEENPELLGLSQRLHHAVCQRVGEHMSACAEARSMEQVGVEKLDLGDRG